MIKKLLLGGLVLALLGGGYYEWLSYSRGVEVYDDVPMARMTESESSPKQPVLDEYPVVDTPLHPASGTVRIIEAEGKTYLRYEGYKTIPGPDLYVYLSKDLEATEFVNLGEIRGTEGDINYEVPEGVALDEYRYVLTWCKQFGVLFNYADLGVPMNENAHEEMMEGDGGGGEGSTMNNNSMKKSMIEHRTTAVMGTGCFWCVEQDFKKVPGVTDVISGYAGGTSENPTYETYAEGGHREVVRITYDPSVVSFGNLVEHVIKYGDPTDGGGSFFDRGEQYAPVVFYNTEAERDEALAVISAIDARKVYEKPIAIDVLPLSLFWPAEAYHQDYGENNPIRYNYYRAGSGRSAFVEKHWGDDADEFVASKKPEPVSSLESTNQGETKPWEAFVKPSEDTLRNTLTPLQYEVTQEEGTERAGTSELDKNYEAGIYVDVVSGEPLFSSRDKYDSGTGWPSFVKPLRDDSVVLHEDKRLFVTRTEVRSRYADSHLGHVFTDGPQDRGGMRYCMNGAALRFVSKAEMEKEGSPYAHLLGSI